MDFPEKIMNANISAMPCHFLAGSLRQGNRDVHKGTAAKTWVLMLSLECRVASHFTNVGPCTTHGNEPPAIGRYGAMGCGCQSLQDRVQTEIL